MEVENAITLDCAVKIDSDTSQPIIFPRVYNLRKMQLSAGFNISELKLEQRGLASVPYLHHISKIMEGKTESFRVRVCRSCSGMQTLLELGSYADMESALLINDCHEILQGRFSHLHVLCEFDVRYISSIYIRKRGATSDITIEQALQDRIMRCKSEKKTNATTLITSESSSNIIDQNKNGKTGKKDFKESSGQYNNNDLKMGENTNGNLYIDSHPFEQERVMFVNPSTESKTLKRKKSSKRKSDQSDGSVIMEREKDKREGFKPSTSSSSSSYSMDDIEITMKSSTSHSSDPSNINPAILMNSKSKESFNESDSMRQSLTSLDGNNIFESFNNSNSMQSNRLMSVLGRFRINLINIRPYLVSLGYSFVVTDDINKLHEAFSLALIPEASGNAALWNDFERQLGDPDIPLTSLKLLSTLRDYNMTRGFVFSLLSSFYSGEVREVHDILRRLKEIIPQDSLPVAKFIEHLHISLRSIEALHELTASLFEKLVRNPVSSGEGASLFTHSEEQSFHHNVLPVIGFLRTAQSAVSYYDYYCRLCVWEEGNAVDIQDIENRLQGCYGQLHIRVVAVIQYLQTLQILLSFPTPNTSNGNMNCLHLFQDIFNRAIIAAAIALQTLITSALTTWKICRDSSVISSCFSLCHTFYPILKNSTCDKVVADLFLKSFLNLIASSLLTSESIITSGNTSGASTANGHFLSIAEIHRLAYSLGDDILKYVQQNYWAIPYALSGTEALLFYESALGSYVAIFILVVSLSENELLQSYGLDSKKLVNAIATSLSGLLEWMQKLGCMCIHSSTLTSLYSLIEASSMAFIRYPDLRSNLFLIARSSRILLLGLTSKFFLAKILLENITPDEERILFNHFANDGTTSSSGK